MLPVDTLGPPQWYSGAKKTLGPASCFEIALDRPQWWSKKEEIKK
jgi:hypothetical protein